MKIVCIFRVACLAQKTTHRKATVAFLSIANLQRGTWAMQKKAIRKCRVVARLKGQWADFRFQTSKWFCIELQNLSPSFQHPASSTICLRCLFVSSEGALYVIVPYDYPAAQHPLFEHTPVLNNNFEY